MRQSLPFVVFLILWFKNSLSTTRYALLSIFLSVRMTIMNRNCILDWSMWMLYVRHKNMWLTAVCRSSSLTPLKPPTSWLNQLIISFIVSREATAVISQTAKSFPTKTGNLLNFSSFVFIETSRWSCKTLTNKAPPVYATQWLAVVFLLLGLLQVRPRLHLPAKRRRQKKETEITAKSNFADASTALGVCAIWKMERLRNDAINSHLLSGQWIVPFDERSSLQLTFEFRWVITLMTGMRSKARA